MDIDAFILDLLHINDVTDNRLIDLMSSDGKTYILKNDTKVEFLPYAVGVAQSFYGKTANTVLRGSAIGKEQLIGFNVASFDWESTNGSKDSASLHKFINDVYQQISLKGNNPIFLGIGGLKWNVIVKDKITKDVLTPILVYPIRLIRSGDNNPVFIEFVYDDVYVNPCLIAKLEQVWGSHFTKDFPHPNGPSAELDDPVDINLLGDGREYFAKVSDFIRTCAQADTTGETVFEFCETVAIAQYNHDELCTYYDIRRHREVIDKSEIIDRIFNKREMRPPVECKISPKYILPKDSTQDNIIKRVVNGESLIIKGPPGTGKTLTIANMVASLIAEGKRVLLACKKTAALSEVYAKLPEKIRKFVMLLDSETEAEASKINPTVIKSELNDLLREREAFKPTSIVDKEYESQRTERANSINSISQYVDLTFENKVILGDNYYKALDTYCRYDLPIINFTTSDKLITFNKESYLSLIELIKRLEDDFSVLTDSNAFDFKKCPWVPALDQTLSCDTEKVLDFYKKITPNVIKVVKEVKDFFAEHNIKCDDLNLSNIASLIEFNICNADLGKILDNIEIDKEVVQQVIDVLIEYQKSGDKSLLNSFVIEYETLEQLEETVKLLEEIKSDKSLTISQWKSLVDQYELLEKFNNKLCFVKVKVEIANLDKNEKDYAFLKDQFDSIITSEAKEEDLDFIAKSFSAISKYVNTNAEKPKLLDFKAKKVFEKVKSLCYDKNADFSTIINAVVLYNGMQEKLSEKEDILSKLNSEMRLSLNAEQISAIKLFVDVVEKTQVSCDKVVENLNADSEVVINASEKCKALGRVSYSIEAMICAYKVHLAMAQILDKVKLLATKWQLELDLNKDNVEKYIIYLNSLSKISKIDNFRIKSRVEQVEILVMIRSSLALTAPTIRKLISDLSSFDELITYYNLYSNWLTVIDLEHFAQTSCDRNVLNHALNYFNTISTYELLPLEKFFRVFENGNASLENNSIFDYFEHSVYGILINFYTALLGVKRNGFGENCESQLNNFMEKSDALEKLEIERIYNLCMRNINVQDPDFAFLNAERALEKSLRLIFKNNAKGLLKLKKCFLISPYSVSVLFRNEAFSNFDVVIMDEASQVTPTVALPALLRSKQCVLVGDEYQMPPIKHFAKLNDKVIVDDDGEEFTLTSDLSVLSLALNNAAFNYGVLNCHYRSKTESLIKFSQNRYYHDMKTFPSVLPKGKGIGLVDVFVENGETSGGINIPEADEVINRLRMHFDEYYNEETGVLSESVGVVAFGVKQLGAIEKRIPADLNKKIMRAKSTFKDEMKEKLIFFKTIETVQGQEAEHLILSLTYGRLPSGKYSNSFGELNNASIGECVFNVAVTRAQSSVTVVHSIKSMHIERDSISFIKEYLEIVEQFGTDDTPQFIETDCGRGFLKSVGEYVISLGIDPKRVVYNYGVNKTSIKIPIAILDKEGKFAQLGLWCETEVDSKEYLDINARYFRSLIERGWKFHRVYAHDWVDNKEFECKKIAELIKTII